MKLAILAIIAFATPAEQGGWNHPLAYEDGVAAGVTDEKAGPAGLLRQVASTEKGESILRPAPEIAPADEDSAAELLQVAQAQGDGATGDVSLLSAELQTGQEPSLRLTLEPLPPSLRPKLEPIVNLPRLQLDLELSHSRIEGGQPHWREGSIQLSYRAKPSRAVSATAELSKRFGLTDLYGELRLNEQLSAGTSLYLAVGGTPDARFRPKWQIQGGGSIRINGGPRATILTLDARQGRYSGGDVQSVAPGVEHYVAGGRAWLSGRWINVFDERGQHRSGWLARGDVMLNDRFRLFLGAADAPDSSEGVVIQTSSVFAGAVLEMSRTRLIRFSVTREDRGAAGNRVQIGAGLGLRF